MMSAMILGIGAVRTMSKLTCVDAADVNFEVALAVLEQAIEEGSASADVPKGKDERRSWAKSKLWKPEYREYVYDPDGLA